MPSINGLTNPFENSVLNSNLTQLEKEKQFLNYSEAIEQGYEPPSEVLDQIAVLLDAGVLSPDAVARLQTLIDQPPNVVDLNAENNSTGQSAFQGTAGADIFVYDFRNSDGSDDTYTITDFNPEDDMIVFVGADASYDGGFEFLIRNEESLYQEIFTNTDGVYTFPNIEAIAVAATADPASGPFIFTFRTFEFNSGDSANEVDAFNITDPDGTPLVFTLDYPDDAITPLEGTVAHVYQGDAEFLL